jgi:hypothetical protein
MVIILNEAKNLSLYGVSKKEGFFAQRHERANAPLRAFRACWGAGEKSAFRL